MTTTTDQDAMSGVAEAAAAITAGEQRLTAAVAEARANGISWARIATALGCSKQAAHERFSPSR